jgi:hypothetical protein
VGNGSYRVLRAKRRGRDAVIVIDASLEPDESAAYPWLVTLTLPIARVNEYGLCDDVESAHLGDIEDRLLSAIDEQDYRYAGRITAEGRREVLLYVADPDAAMDRLRREARAIGQPISLGKEHEPDWDTYLQFVP